MSLSEYHYYSAANYTPAVTAHFDWRMLRRTAWRVQNRDASYGVFISWWFFGHLQFYHGSSKCDGSESFKATHIVMVDKPSELLAFRWRTAGPGAVEWSNQGGS